MSSATESEPLHYISAIFRPKFVTLRGDRRGAIISEPTRQLNVADPTRASTYLSMKYNHVIIKDIARELGISPSTVSRALNDHPDISPVTKRAVNELAEKLIYQP